MLTEIQIKKYEQTASHLCSKPIQNVAQTFSLWGVRRKLKVYATGTKLLSNSRYLINTD